MWDPLRRRQVADTPEEQVRQWFIGRLIADCGVPAHMMMSEVPFKFGDKPYRADILVYDRSTQPVAVVECKRPDVALDVEVAHQALRYNSVLDVKWIILTNGGSTLVFHKNDDGEFVQAGQLPTYQEMTL